MHTSALCFSLSLSLSLFLSPSLILSSISYSHWCHSANWSHQVMCSRIVTSSWHFSSIVLVAFYSKSIWTSLSVLSNPPDKTISKHITQLRGGIVKNMTGRGTGDFVCTYWYNQQKEVRWESGGDEINVRLCKDSVSFVLVQKLVLFRSWLGGVLIKVVQELAVMM